MAVVSVGVVVSVAVVSLVAESVTGAVSAVVAGGELEEEEHPRTAATRTADKMVERMPLVRPGPAFVKGRPLDDCAALVDSTLAR